MNVVASNQSPEQQQRQVAAAALSDRFERQLLAGGRGHGSRSGRAVPVLVITGFLGSGKTTLTQHLLQASTGTGQQLRLGVLVNEIASLDVDGQLLRSGSSNATVGVRSAALAGGCACCSVTGDLQAALQEMAGSPAYATLDGLLLETSGVAEVEPLAALLAQCGFRLAGVVTVLDAEAGAQQLAQQPVAAAQLRAADVAVINKCDLVSLTAVSAVEDVARQQVPGLRTLRARFGQVPAEALLDLDPEEPEEQQQQQQQPGGGAAAAAATAAAAAQTCHGEVAFLSHEPVVSLASKRAAGAAGCLLPRSQTPRLAAAAAAAAQLEDGAPPASHHHHHHSSGFVSVSFSSPEPLCMACFQAWTSDHLRAASGLFRCKGFVFFCQARLLRYVFHLSGKQRAECGSDGAWQGPPGVQLVLIGNDRGELLQLRGRLKACTAGACGCCCTDADGQQRQQQPSDTSGAAAAAAAAFAQLVEQHHRLQLCAPQQQQQQRPSGLASGRCLVEFSAIGSPLHGVVAEEVNASLLRAANAAPGLFLCHVQAPRVILASGSGQRAACQGVARLQLCCRAGDDDGEACWRRFEMAVAPVLRSAYAHVHSCKCDVVALMHHSR